MKFKSLGALILVAVMVLSGCSQESDNSSEYSIVVSTFHEYDWVMEVLGEERDSFEVTLITDSGDDLHSYAPTAADIATIGSADLFIYNGGHSHSWVADVIAEPTNENFRSLNVVESLGDAVKPEVAVDGMQIDSAEDDHDHSEEAHDHEEDDHDHSEETHDHEEDDHGHSEEANAHDDEHVWMSLHNAMTACEVLAEEIGALDAENADIYVENANAYIQTLSALDQDYKDVIAEAEKDTLIFADRFPFLYLMDDYDIEYFAAFQGCSTETEASFETVTFLAEKVNALDVDELLIMEGGLVELAETVNSSSDKQNCEILTLNSMQAVSQEDIDAGATYYKYMEENLEVIKKALN